MPPILAGQVSGGDGIPGALHPLRVFAGVLV